MGTAKVSKSRAPAWSAAALHHRRAEREAVRHGHDLVGHDDRHLERSCDALEFAEVRLQELLPLGELAAAGVLGAQVAHNAVDYDEAVLAVLGRREQPRRDADRLTLLVEARDVDGL